MPSSTVALSIDVEDWHQMVSRAFGVEQWDRPNRHFERQMREVFDFLDDVGGSATFFMLGQTIKNYPELAQEAARKGIEIATHGFGHEQVFTLDEKQFRRDVETSIDLLVKHTGTRPVGYRAPLFSINQDTVWALEVLSELGFEYDSSLYDTPKVPRRIAGIPRRATQLELPSGRTIWELPPSTLDLGGFRLPMGGGSYWRLFPSWVLIPALRRIASRDESRALYFHPYEFDSEPLVSPMPAELSPRNLLRAGWVTARYWVGHTQLLTRLRKAGQHFGFLRYRDAMDEVRSTLGARARSLSRAGVIL